MELPFDELALLRQLKDRPGIFFGKKSLLSLRDFLWGVDYGLDIAANGQYKGQTHFPILFEGFVPWYIRRYVKDENGYAAWWNHLLYISGNRDDWAFDRFFSYLEEYLNSELHRTLAQEA